MVAQTFLSVAGKNTDYADETDLLDWNKKKESDIQDKTCILFILISYKISCPSCLSVLK